MTNHYDSANVSYYSPMLSDDYWKFAPNNGNPRPVKLCGARHPGDCCLDCGPCCKGNPYA